MKSVLAAKTGFVSQLWHSFAVAMRLFFAKAVLLLSLERRQFAIQADPFALIDLRLF